MIVLGLQRPFADKNWTIHEVGKKRRYRSAHNSYYVEGVEIEELWVNEKENKQERVIRRLYSDRIRYRERNKYAKHSNSSTGD